MRREKRLSYATAATETRLRIEHYPNCGGALKIIAAIEAPSVWKVEPVTAAPPAYP